MSTKTVFGRNVERLLQDLSKVQSADNSFERLGETECWLLRRGGGQLCCK